MSTWEEPLFEYNAYLSDIDTCISLAKSVSVPQFSDDSNRVETSILRECGRNDLECVCIRLEAVSFHTFQSLGILGQES